MVTAFAGFAAEGNVCAPRALTEVTAVDGTSYPVPAVSCKQAISKETARGTNYATQEVMKTGSGQLLEYGDIPMAGKTGTNDQRSQTWFMGYNSGMATASWIGNWKKGNTSLSGLQIGGQLYPEIDGSLIAAPSWARFMQQIPGLYVGKPFQDPPANLINGRQSVPFFGGPGGQGGQGTGNGTVPGVPGVGGILGGAAGPGNSGNGNGGEGDG
jgi:membrane peptidoglycan carboxypeptidase